MLYNIFYIFLLFIIYSFIGWLVEVATELITDRKLVNRGFLIGPICPIYGVGILLMVKLLSRFINTPVILFLLAIIIFMTLEYLTSYVMEKLFNARWWDYSKHKFNLNGRICLNTTIPFGLGGMLIMYLVNPFINSLLSKVNHKLIIIIGIITLIIFLVDFIISFSVISKLKKIIKNKYKYKDDTEEMNIRVKDYLMKLSPLTKRLMESFPGVKMNLAKLKTKIEAKVKKK